MSEEGVQVISSPAFKLRDKQGRRYKRVRLADFGFIPEEIIIEKVPGMSNTIVLRAIVTEEYLLQIEKQKNGKSSDKKGSKKSKDSTDVQ